MDKSVNKLDKIKISIPNKYYCYEGDENKKYFLGGNFVINDERMVLELSGKINSSANSLGTITEENIENALKKLKAEQGLSIDIPYFVENADIYRIDVKKDITLSENPTEYLSKFKEIFKKNSDKYNIYSYASLKYEDGLELIPIAKSAGHKLLMYAKHREILSKRHSDYGYYEQFDYEFLESIKNTIRSELQLKKFADIRHIFSLDREKITLKKVFDCKKDVVKEKLCSLIK